MSLILGGVNMVVYSIFAASSWWLIEHVGRRKLFILTLAIYLIGSGIAGFAQDFWFLAVFRFIAGLGIGGEYAAINSAITAGSRCGSGCASSTLTPALVYFPPGTLHIIRECARCR